MRGLPRENGHNQHLLFEGALDTAWSEGSDALTVTYNVGGGGGHSLTLAMAVSLRAPSLLCAKTTNSEHKIPHLANAGRPCLTFYHCRPQDSLSHLKGALFATNWCIPRRPPVYPQESPGVVVVCLERAVSRTRSTCGEHGPVVLQVRVVCWTTDDASAGA